MGESVKFDELIIELEADEAMRMHLVEARKWLARTYYKPGDAHYERLMRGEGPCSGTRGQEGTE